MSANRLPLPTTSGREVALSRTEASTLVNFRRTAYAAPIKEILLKVLDEARLENETTVSTEENRARVAAAKDLITVLFDSKVVLE